MSTRDALSNWELDPAITAIYNVRCGIGEPGGAACMTARMEDINPMLTLLPELVAKALAYRRDLPEEHRELLEKGAGFMLLVVCEYGENEKFLQEFQNRPVVPKPRPGEDGSVSELGAASDGDAS